MNNEFGSARELTWAAVTARRLERHHLATPRPDTRPVDVVKAMSGAHAQILAAAELSIGIRIEGIDRAAIRDALWTERSLVKTFGPRGTVHLLPTEDLPIWTGALGAVPVPPHRMPPDARMTPDQADAVIEAIGVALEDSELTIDELTEAVAARAGSWAGDRVMPAFQDAWPRWRQITDVAANRGVLCFGPNRGRKITYTNPHRWLPGFRPLDGPSAVAEVVRRYLHAYGPARSEDFARWLAAPPRWAADAFGALGDELVRVRLGENVTWQLASDADLRDGDPPRGVRLLSYFDAYAVGSHPRSLLFPGRAFDRALARGQAGNFPVVLVDGTVGGIWHQRGSGRDLGLTVELFEPLDAGRRRDLDAQVARLADFLEVRPRMTFGTIPVGPHA
ncbi:MAG TPA: winged helix DNA-binding domain-containing protein [Candidatus Limnocylindrales bacterium]|nr:winged helix DNA-binding domain-containing protein [Candidatus Limnocylindrales bacterium]